ncbi:MAG: hypothetical protein ACKVVP_16530, partial [Chloroflexota bacterium]
EIVQARDSRYPEGGVAVWLEGAALGRPARAIPDRLIELPWLNALLAPVYTGYRSGLAQLQLEADGVSALMPGSIWQSEAARIERLADGPYRSVTLRVEALRPSTPFALRTRVQGDEGYQTLARPESRDLVLSRVRDGRVVQELENRGSPFRKDWIAALQSVVRELGRTWLFALFLVVGAALVWQLPGGRGREAQWARAKGWRPAAAGTTIALGSLGLAAVLVTSWISLTVFEAVPHDRDSVAYLFQARLFASGSVSAPAPALPEFFKEDFIIQRDGRWFGKYPPGHPLILALGILVGAPWLVGPMLSGLAVLLLGMLGKRLFGSVQGALAATLLLSSPFFLFMSGSYLAHSTSLVLTLAALMVFSALVGVRSDFHVVRRHAGDCQSPLQRPVTRRGDWQSPEQDHGDNVRTRGVRDTQGVAWAIMLGLSLGGLVCTRQLTGIALSACLGAWLLLGSGRSWRERLAFALFAALGALLPLFFLLWFQHATTGNALTSPQVLWWEFDRIGFGTGVGAEGWHDPAMGLHDTWDRLTELQRHLFGWPFYLTLAPAMLPFISGRAGRRDWWLLSVIVSLVLAYVLYWNRGMAYGPRYYYEALGPLCLLSIRGFAVLATLGNGKFNPRGAAYVSVLGAALVAFNVFLYLPQQVRDFRGYLGVDGRRAMHVRAAGIDHSLIFVREEPRGAWQPYASVFWMNAPTLDRGIVFARDRGAEENQRLQRVLSDQPAYLLTLSGLARIPDRT